GDWPVQIPIIRRNFHHSLNLADSVKVDMRRKSGTGPVLIPLVEDQSRTWHQIQHASDNRPVEPRRRHLAIGGKATLGLRPTSVQEERKRASAALSVWRAVRPAVPCRLAIGGRPGQSQHVIIESAGFAVAPLLS